MGAVDDVFGGTPEVRLYEPIDGATEKEATLPCGAAPSPGRTIDQRLNETPPCKCKFRRWELPL
jgi:hypothetical protein